jgi:uncharacterized membrane protein YebE (DUF533 family)
MFNTSDLLGSLLQAGLRGSSMGRLEHAMGDRGLGAPGGPLGQILGQLGGGSRGADYGGYSGGGYGQAPAGGGYGGAGGGGLGDLLGGLAGMTGAGGYGSPSYSGGRPVGRDLLMGGLGALASAILSGRGRSTGGGLGSAMGGMLGGNMRGAVGAGGLTLLAMLAMKALQGGGRQQGLGFAGLGQEPPEQAVSERTAGLVVRAMIDAAKADGTIDATERQKIMAKLDESGAAPEERAFLEQEMSRPLDPDALATEAGGDPVVAAQLYAASLLAIQVDSPAEQAYLRDLAARLGLDAGTVTQLHQALGAPEA